MAAAVSNPWGKPRSWALEAEEHEDELRQERTPQPEEDLASEFPSLSAAANTKTKKKNKKQTISLAEFSASDAANPSRTQIDRLTTDEMFVLPTGPRQRSPEELERSRLGGGFRSYGAGRYGDDSSSQRWGSGSFRVSDDGGRRREGFGRDSSRELPPSRADEIDNWAAAKKSAVGNGFERRDRSGFFESHSRADEVDNWGANKSMETRRAFGGTGGGRFERLGSFESLSRNRDVPNGGGGPDSDSWGRRKEDIHGGGVGSRRKLVLQPRSLPVANSKNENSPVGEAKPKGSNPFGDARPREEVLAGKGKDWKEIDEKLEAVKIRNMSTERGESFSKKKSFGLGNGRDVDMMERSWRKSNEEEENEAATAAEQGEEAKEEEKP